MGQEKILFLDNGRIVEQGPHTQLMEQKGEYADMYRMQAEAYHMDVAWREVLEE